ncbi:uncharacterized protein LOC119688375 [Teleopsis dalmanni]|uniref:uncharacterized protein LOC119688375 n=1 Tax=Teleopsis dalmanni TaxID=139649 RepID=UPI0018CF43B5|nr:uncharacterized protein LOC119688375 [Teleopsis dalmanni]
MEKILFELKHLLKTFVCFIIACLLLPALLISFICVHYSNEIVNYVLSIKYPGLTISKSKQIRTLIDTPRNAGIFHFLLKVKGSCEFEKIKEYYASNLTDRRDKAGFLRFPKLRQRLVACWGHYAWVNDSSSFNINNHILMASRTFRGRPVNETNIEDYISDLATKYIPSDLPQWQVLIIPTFAVDQNTGGCQVIQNDHYYVLIKVHHLIIAEEEDLHISEILMLHDVQRRAVIDIGKLGSTANHPELSHFVCKPVHISKLCHHLLNALLNWWNAFIYEFESLEMPDGYRNAHIGNIRQLLSVCLIIVVNTVLKYFEKIKIHNKLKRRNSPFTENCSKFSIFSELLMKEIEERELSWQVVQNVAGSSCWPPNILKFLTKLIWYININCFYRFPYLLYCEFWALRDLLFFGITKRTATLCNCLAVYLPLTIYAHMEFLKICYELYKAPVNIFEELFENPSKETNILHKKSYSGRKIITFTKSISALDLRHRIDFNKELRESDFVLACLAGALNDYFHTFNDIATVPIMLNTTCRTIEKGYFTERLCDEIEHIGGAVFLSLPLSEPDKLQVNKVNEIVKKIRDKQIMIYLASMGQTRFNILTSLIPRILTKIFINYFSFNFPVTITEIHGKNSDFQTIWGQTVEDVLLFRPPQSKTSLSLNIHRFGDKYRLAIMADTHLAPNHTEISRAFEHYMENTIFKH